MKSFGRVRILYLTWDVVLQLLLGYLPNDRGLWASELAKKRSQYKAFKDELLVNPVSHPSALVTLGHFTLEYVLI